MVLVVMGAHMGMVARLSLLSTSRMGQRISVATVKIKCWDFPRLLWIVPSNATGSRESLGAKLPLTSLSPRPTSSI